MITRTDAAWRAYQITEYPADDPECGWALEVFSHGWLVRCQDRDPAVFCIVIERATGLVRYFTGTDPQQLYTDYDALRLNGHPDYLWEEPADIG